MTHCETTAKTGGGIGLAIDVEGKVTVNECH